MVLNCPYCGSTNVIKRGWRKTRDKTVWTQRYGCNNCLRRFTPEPYRSWEKANFIELIRTLRDDGLSYREIADFLMDEYEVWIHHTTIYRWLNSR